MANPRGGSAVAAQWRAVCLFCGERLPDEGAGWTAHLARRPACQRSFDRRVRDIDRELRR